MDNGPGIPADIIDRIFEPYLPQRAEEGTGLGLAIIHGIVKAMRAGSHGSSLIQDGIFHISSLVDGEVATGEDVKSEMKGERKGCFLWMTRRRLSRH
jgi:signal transduction histidine kinase